MANSQLIDTLQSRGHLYQCTDLEALDDQANKKVITGYCGFDATAQSFHVGNLIPVTMLRRLQQAGHKPIVLMGGATTRIGDPSGKDETRKMLSEEDIELNIARLTNTFGKFITFGDGPTDAVIVNNYDWFKDIHYLDLLREIGPHYTVNRMMTMESVKQRLEREQPLTFLEFNYMILQGYDFMELNKRHNCTLQVGGSDQYGNIISGVELCRRKAGKQVFGLTCELLTTASGKKMGKTEDGAVWLDADKLSPYEYWQYWRNTEDADVIRFMKIFTDLPLSDIEEYAKLEGAKINDAKIALAHEATKICHGEEEAKKAHATATETFKEGKASAGLPQIELDKALLEGGIGVLELFTKAGLADTNSEARRLIKGGGAKINDKAVHSPEDQVTPDFIENGAIKLSAGKKRHVLVVLI